MNYLKPSIYSIPLVKNVIYIIEFNFRYRRFRETGISIRYKSKYTPRKPPCMAESFVFSVGLEYTGALFVFLLVSICVASIILILEILEYKLFKTKPVKYYFVK